MTEPDEGKRVEAAKTSPEAFGELYEQYVDRIYSYIYHRVGNVHDAEDLTSRTFYRALSHLSTYEDKGVPFSAWLYRIAHNLVANWHRDRGRRPVIALDEIVLRSRADLHPERVVESNDETRLLLEAIERLDGVRRELLVLKHAEGLSNAEIGAIMGRSEGAIKSLYHRTLLALRKDLAKRGVKVE
ncbi:MAG TPA: sigma-70 family RNA polymerase sigma factor [Chloroflexi bacterium]|jgi:RNA polymerase sigma-70 factor (ECF subfamily)|nr:sigma-70 family RNA polymerase sigma factor [Chloroflexota bacterium]